MPKLEAIVNQEEKKLEVPTFTKKEIEEIAFNATVIYIDLGNTANYEKDGNDYQLQSELVKTIIERLNKEWDGKRSIRVHFKENNSDYLIQDTSNLTIVPGSGDYEKYPSYTYFIWSSYGYSQVNDGEETIGVVFNKIFDIDTEKYVYNGTITHVSV